MNMLLYVKWRLLGWIVSIMLCAFGLYTQSISMTLVFLVPLVGFAIALGTGLEHAEDRFYCVAALNGVQALLTLVGPGAVFDQYRRALVSSVVRNLHYAESVAYFEDEVQRAIDRAYEKKKVVRNSIPAIRPSTPSSTGFGVERSSVVPRLEPTVVAEPTKSLRVLKGPYAEKEPDLEGLLAIAQSRTMTAEERGKQRISFAYGNVNLADPNVTKELVEEVAATKKGEA